MYFFFLHYQQICFQFTKSLITVRKEKGFSLDNIAIQCLKDPTDLFISSVANSSRMYKFYTFETLSSITIGFIFHANDLRKLSHEWFGHLNYRHLQTPYGATSKSISCNNGVWWLCT